MSYLTDNPDLMFEALVVLVRRSGGSVSIAKEEGPGPCSLLSKWDGESLHLMLDETITADEARRIMASDGEIAAL